MKKLVVLSLLITTSCGWTTRQANSFMDWANETMPTYDGSRPGLEGQQPQQTEIPVSNQSYYQPSSPVAPIPAPDQGQVMPHSFDQYSTTPPQPQQPPMMPAPQAYQAPAGAAPPMPMQPQMQPQQSAPAGVGQPATQMPNPYGQMSAEQDDFPEEYQDVNAPSQKTRQDQRQYIGREALMEDPGIPMPPR